MLVSVRWQGGRSSTFLPQCIRVAEHNTRKMLISELLNRTRLEKLLRDSYGNYCVQVRPPITVLSQRVGFAERECRRPLWTMLNRINVHFWLKAFDLSCL